MNGPHAGFPTRGDLLRRRSGPRSGPDPGSVASRGEVGIVETVRPSGAHRGAENARWRSTRRALAAALVLAALAFGFIGARGLWEPDEGRYVGVALEMLRSGDWLHPALQPDVPHYTKPPLEYWLEAGSLALFGHTDRGARLPGALAFAATALAVGALARRLVPGRALAASLVYATSALPFLASNIVTTDTVLTLWETLAVLGFVWAWLERPGTGCDDTARCREPLALAGLLVMWGALALAFLTKGPPGLLPLVAVVATCGLFAGRRAVGRLFHPAGLGLFLLLGGWWYAAVVASHPDLARYFLVYEVFDRVFTATHGRNPDWYMAFIYPPILAAGMLPWSTMWLSRRARDRLVDLARRPLRDPIGLLLLLWIAVPLVVFMLARSRLPLYVLPLGAPLALATARLLPGDGLERGPGRGAFLAAAAVLLAMRLAGGAVSDDMDDRRYAAALDAPEPVGEIVFVDRRPRYGLALYLGCPVEAIDTATNPSALEQELDRFATGLVLVMPDTSAPAVTRALAGRSWSLRSSRRIGHDVAMRVAPPAAAGRT